MLSRSLEKQPNIGYRVLAFIAHSNIFISVCTTSLAAFTFVVFKEKISLPILAITFGTTFLLYNTQQLFLGFLVVRKTPEYIKWLRKNRFLLVLMLFVALAEVYPLWLSTLDFMLTYTVAFLVSLLYFMPYTNLRRIPLLKSLIIGFVWTMVCVIAPLGTDDMTNEKINFGTAQLLFITALCVLFNIRDVEQDRLMGTHTVPVLYGTRTAKIFALVILVGHLVASYFVSNDPAFKMIAVTTFLLGVFFTLRSFPKNHVFYYLYGVDGLILAQSVLGIVFLRV